MSFTGPMWRLAMPERSNVGEVLLEYRSFVCARDGQAYRVLAYGGAASDGTRRWQGWLEFLPAAGGPRVRTACETSQPNKMCTVYWSTGLTQAYLQGALERALKLAATRSRVGAGAVTASFQPGGAASSVVAPKSILKLTRADRRFLKSLGIAQD